MRDSVREQRYLFVYRVCMTVMSSAPSRREDAAVKAEYALRREVRSLSFQLARNGLPASIVSEAVTAFYNGRHAGAARNAPMPAPASTGVQPAMPDIQPQNPASHPPVAAKPHHGGKGARAKRAALRAAAKAARSDVGMAAQAGAQPTDAVMEDANQPAADSVALQAAPVAPMAPPAPMVPPAADAATLARAPAAAPPAQPSARFSGLLGAIQGFSRQKFAQCAFEQVHGELNDVIAAASLSEPDLGRALWAAGELCDMLKPSSTTEGAKAAKSKRATLRRTLGGQLPADLLARHTAAWDQAFAAKTQVAAHLRPHS